MDTNTTAAVRPKKDNRIVYKNKKIAVNGNTVSFDGKYNPDKKTLRVYRVYGDVTLHDEALQNFAIENNIDKVIKL